MQKLTAIIPTKNEAHNIVEAIQSVNFADEIIIVDSFSTDKTLNLAKPRVTRVIQREYENSASQKNWAIPQAKYDWILILDADERVTQSLREEIQQILSNNPKESGFWIYRNNHFMGKKVRFSGWQGDKVIRLFKKNECQYEQKNVHAEISTKGEIGWLKNRIHHNTFMSIQEYLIKIRRYADWQSEDYYHTTNILTPYHFLIKPLARFIKHYFLQLGFLDGFVGLTIASIQAYAVFLRYVKLWKLRREERA
jgi:glycosyltransferase involved in cell wall biosynthesis